MINDLITKLILAFDDLLTNIGLYTKLTVLLNHLSDFTQYTTEFQKYLSGVYFIFGKALIVYMISVFVVVVAVRIVFSIVHLVGQFVP